MTTRQLFGNIRRLHGAEAFDAVFKAKLRKSDGCLTVWLRPNNGHRFSRLGLSIAKRDHKLAVRRTKIKRRIREAFRLSQDEHPMLNEQGYDIIVRLHAHPGILSVADIKTSMLQAIQAAHKVAIKRAGKEGTCQS